MHIYIYIHATPSMPRARTHTKRLQGLVVNSPWGQLGGKSITLGKRQRVEKKSHVGCVGARGFSQEAGAGMKSKSL